MNHTKEPWHVRHGTFIASGTICLGACLTGRGLDGEANARRIVACVNACSGVDSDLLEAYPAPFSKLREQRDELLAVVEELAESAAYWCEYDVPLGIVDRINAAIANVKGVA